MVRLLIIQKNGNDFYKFPQFHISRRNLPCYSNASFMTSYCTLFSTGSEHSISPPLHVSCSFKRPLYMPSDAVLLCTQLDTNQEMHFEVRDGETTAVLHLAGKITAL